MRPTMGYQLVKQPNGDYAIWSEERQSFLWTCGTLKKVTEVIKQLQPYSTPEQLTPNSAYKEYEEKILDRIWDDSETLDSLKEIIHPDFLFSALVHPCGADSGEIGDHWLTKEFPRPERTFADELEQLADICESTGGFLFDKKGVAHKPKEWADKLRAKAKQINEVLLWS